MHIRTYSRAMGEPAAGMWKLLRREGELAATGLCPECGASEDFGPGTEYRIDADGKVPQPFECATADCEFRGYVRLAGWTDRELFAAFDGL